MYCDADKKKAEVSEAYDRHISSCSIMLNFIGDLKFVNALN
jgi:hypothetical protein